MINFIDFPFIFLGIYAPLTCTLAQFHNSFRLQAVDTSNIISSLFPSLPSKAVLFTTCILSGTLITLTAGTVLGWTSPTLPNLLAPDSHIPITADDSSWIASITILVSIISVLPAAYISDRFGRKRTLLSASIPYAVGWIMIIFASTKEELYISRAISGLGHGIVYTVMPMYLGEIASDQIRGSLACMITLMNKVINLQFYILFRLSINGYNLSADNSVTYLPI